MRANETDAPKGRKAMRHAAESGELGESRQLLVYGIVLGVMCVIALAPLVAIAPFDRPSADDFPYSLTTHAVVVGSQGGLPDLLGAAVQLSADMYQTWQGLYTSAFFLALQPGIFGSAWYQVGAYVMLACIVFASLFLAYAAGRHLFGVKARHWAPVGCLLATYLLQGMPVINEAVYWYNGAANYTPWFCAAMVASGCCIIALRAESRVRIGIAVGVASLLGLLVGGCNYMPAFIFIMAMVGFAVIGVFRRRFALIAPLIFVVAGFVVSVTAPGTAVRQAMFPDHPGVVSTLAHSTWQALMNIHSFADITLLVALLLAVPFIAMWVRATDIRFSPRGLAMVVALSFIALVGANCVPFYGTGSFGIGRTYNTCFELFTVSAFITWVYMTGLVLERARSARTGARALTRRLSDGAVLSAAIAVVGVGLIVFWGGLAVAQEHGNSFQAARELANGTASAYAREYDERDAALLSAGPDDTVVVAPLQTQSEVLFFSDINGKYGDDWSGAIAQYYDVGKVVVQEDGNNEKEAL